MFNPDKLFWFNGQYINDFGVGELVDRLRPDLAKTGIWDERFAGGDASWFASVVGLIRPRFRSLVDLAEEVRTYVDADIEFDPAAIARFVKEPKLAGYLPELASRLETLDPFDLAGTEAAVRGLAEELEVKAGLLINASRVALTGKAVAPGMFDVMVVLGRDKTVARLRRAAKEIFWSSTRRTRIGVEQILICAICVICVKTFRPCIIDSLWPGSSAKRNRSRWARNGRSCLRGSGSSV